jgi:hypothetical protein
MCEECKATREAVTDIVRLAVDSAISPTENRFALKRDLVIATAKLASTPNVFMMTARVFDMIADCFNTVSETLEQTGGDIDLAVTLVHEAFASAELFTKLGQGNADVIILRGRTRRNRSKEETSDGNDGN